MNNLQMKISAGKCDLWFLISPRSVIGTSHRSVKGLSSKLKRH
jgi:hypothetical protein